MAKQYIEQKYSKSKIIEKEKKEKWEKLEN